MSKSLDDLSPQEKREMLAKILKEKANKKNIKFPLSYGQQALWFIYELAPESVAYNLLYTAKIRKSIDYEILKKSFEFLTKRHPALKTKYIRQEGEPLQQFYRDIPLSFQVIDASGWSNSEVNEWINKEADRPFNLEEGDIFRVSLLTFSDANKLPILVLTIHHIAAEFWSFEIIIHELEIIHNALKENEKPPLKALTATYKDYVQWEKQHLASHEGEKQWQYWQQKLSGELPIINLSTDRPRPPVQTYNGETYYFEIDEELTNQLRELAKSEGVTLYVTILAAFQVLLSRYSGQEDILIGSPLVNRSNSDFENLIGYFVNPVVLRGNLSKNPTFKKLLSRTQTVVLEALENQNIPFSLLFQKLQAVRDPSRSPIFQVLLSWDRPHQSKQLSQNKLILESLNLEQRGCAFDISLIIMETTKKLKVNWGYNVDLFDQSTIKQMAESFKMLLQGIIVNTKQNIGQLPLLTDTQRNHILGEWGNKNNVLKVIEEKQPILRQIKKTQIYLLDLNLQLVPIGVPGELYIGGDGLRQLELTDAQLIPNPFSEGTLLYKTGDLYRYLRDGNIENLGPINHQLKKQYQPIIVASTFTSEPVEAPLNYWLETLNLPFKLGFSPYNQVFQELLNPESQLNQNQAGINLLLIRLEDWVRFDKTVNTPDQFAQKIRQNTQELIGAIQQGIQSNQSPLMVVLCPSQPNLEPEKQLVIQQNEALIISQLRQLGQVNLISSQDIATTYPVSNYYDKNSDDIGHIPYTDVFYTAIGTAIARKIYALQQPPYKVIVLDCDNTLWEGVCGEVGADGVKIDTPRKALQSFFVEQQKAGKLLCLCSKNEEKDVWAVFEAQTEMPLKKEDLVAWRINWQAKSENLKTLARELNLGLDSFIFIDDNPVECAEVQTNCPQVLTLQLPENPEDISQFLQHIWAFDNTKITAEDARRTKMYQQQKEREKLQKQSVSFEDFLKGLNLEVKFEEITSANLERVAQLTQRTNQFNLTTIRRTEAEIKQSLSTGELEGKSIGVKDRFGDYGLVGVLLYRTQSTKLIVDTLLLSCRVLGRGVEYEMVKYLGKVAQKKQLSHIQIPYYPTPKNPPAKDFLENIGKDKFKKTQQGQLLELVSEDVVNLSFTGKETKISNNRQSLSLAETSNLPAPSELLMKIGTKLRTPQEIGHDIAVRQQKIRSEEIGEYVAPRNQVEEQLALIWEEVLKVDKVGIYDNFFAIGGNSLLATQVVSRIRETFKLEVSVHTLFSWSTLTELADYINNLTWAVKQDQLETNDEDYEEGEL